jgi:hypothetical protein
MPSILDVCIMYLAASNEYLSTADRDRLEVANKWMCATGDEIWRIDRLRYDLSHPRFTDDIDVEIRMLENGL